MSSEKITTELSETCDSWVSSMKQAASNLNLLFKIPFLEKWLFMIKDCLGSFFQLDAGTRRDIQSWIPDAKACWYLYVEQPGTIHALTRCPTLLRPGLALCKHSCNNVAEKGTCSSISIFFFLTFSCWIHVARTEFYIEVFNLWCYGIFRPKLSVKKKTQKTKIG